MEKIIIAALVILDIYFWAKVNDLELTLAIFKGRLNFYEGEYKRLLKELENGKEGI